MAYEFLQKLFNKKFLSFEIITNFSKPVFSHSVTGSMCYPKFPNHCHKFPNTLFWLLNQVIFHGIKIKIYFINCQVYLSLDLSLKEARGSCFCMGEEDMVSLFHLWMEQNRALSSSAPQRKEYKNTLILVFPFLSPPLFNISSCPERRVGCGTETLWGCFCVSENPSRSWPLTLQSFLSPMVHTSQEHLWCCFHEGNILTGNILKVLYTLRVMEMQINRSIFSPVSSA